MFSCCPSVHPCHLSSPIGFFFLSPRETRFFLFLFCVLIVYLFCPHLQHLLGVRSINPLTYSVTHEHSSLLTFTSYSCSLYLFCFFLYCVACVYCCVRHFSTTLVSCPAIRCSHVCVASRRRLCLCSCMCCLPCCLLSVLLCHVPPSR